MVINVVNKRKHKPTPHDFYCGRPSVLGNKYTHITDKKTQAIHIVATREEAIRKYEEDFKVALKTDKAVQEEFEKIFSHLREHKEVTLICWCAPAPCHCDVLKSYLKRHYFDYYFET